MKKYVILLCLLLLAACAPQTDNSVPDNAVVINEPEPQAMPPVKAPTAQSAPSTTKPVAQVPTVQLDIEDLTCESLYGRQALEKLFEVSLDQDQRYANGALRCRYRDLFSNMEVMQIVISRDPQPAISESAVSKSMIFATQYFLDEYSPDGPLIKFIDHDTMVVVELQLYDSNSQLRNTAREKVKQYGSLKTAMVQEVFFTRDMEKAGVTSEMDWTDVPPKPLYANVENAEMLAKAIANTLG